MKTLGDDWWELQAAFQRHEDRYHVDHHGRDSTNKEIVTIPRAAGPLHATSIKVTIVLDPIEVMGVSASAGSGLVPITIHVAGRILRAQFSPKSVRKARTAIEAAPPDGIAVILQGRLAAGDVIEDAGVAAHPKGPRPPSPEDKGEVR
jgi:hypothetical protein